MHAIDALDRKALEEPILDHRQRARAAFFRRLEAEYQRAVEIARLGEMFGRAEQQRGVAVVAAGVHAAGNLGGVFRAAGFEDRQRVHVGAQQRPLLRPIRGPIGAVQQPDDARAADALVHLVEAEFRQPPGDQRRRASDLVEQLGMAMEVAPPFGELGNQRGDGILHGGVHAVFLVSGLGRGGKRGGRSASQ